VSDPLVQASSEVIGGPLGRHARTGAPYRTWWLPIRVLLALAFLGSSLAFISFEHCRAADWQSPDMYVHACYSDAAAIYTSRGLDQHRNPFSARGDEGALAYPIVTNAVIAATSWMVPTGTAPERRRTFFDITALLAVIFMVVTVIATSRLVDPWRDAIFVAIAPAGLLSLFIGWDALGAMLTVLGMLFHRRGSPVLAGILFGLAIATTFYPILILVALLLIQDRAVPGDDRTIIISLATWVGLSAIVAVFSLSGVTAFYQQLFQQGASYGSIWLALTLLVSWTPPALNLFWLGSLVIVTSALAATIRRRHLRPTLAQAALLVGAAYFITAKSFAPQHILWLIPLAAMAGLRWRDLVIWQGIEVTYYVAVWQYIAVVSDAKRGLDADAYGWITMLHIAGLAFLIWRTLQVIEERRGLPDARDPHPVSPGSHQPSLD
jgi:uncharacterized membrane protein